MRTRFNAVFSSLIVLAGCVSGPVMAAQSQPTAATQTGPSVAKPTPVPLMWKACDADNCLYLLGSFHALRKDDYPLSKDVDAALGTAVRVLFEIDPAEAKDKAATGMALLQAGIRKDSSTLDDDLTPAQKAKLDAWIKRNEAALAKSGMNGEMLRMMQPWLAATMITVSSFAQLGLQPAQGLDEHLMGRASQAGKQGGGLETVTEQVGFLSGLSRGDQIAMLEESVDDAQDTAGEITRMHDAWRSGDAVGLWKESGAKMRERYPGAYRAILVERNARWIPKLATLLDTKGERDALVVVGALHLLGPDGVVNMLRARGYRVERVCSACNVQQMRGDSTSESKP